MGKETKKIIVKALNALALALTDHSHQWTNEERHLYEKAIAILT
jgi:hypothetical protein